MAEAKRSWQEKFSAPPPPALPGGAAPGDGRPRHLSAAEEPQPDLPAEETAPSAGPAQAPEAQVAASTQDTAAPPAPVERPGVSARPSESSGDVRPPVTRAEKAHATKIVAALADAGVDGHLVGTRRGSGHTSYDIELTDRADVQAVVLLAEEKLPAALDADAVRVTRRSDGRTVRVDVDAAEAEPGKGAQRAIWVPLEVRDAVLKEKDRTGESVTAYVLGAFNRQYGKLDSLFVRRVAAPGPMPIKNARRRRGIEASVQLWLYLNEEQVEVLDDAVDRAGAGSRSALVTKMIMADLGLEGVRGA